jgi:hypothetical protein
VLLYALFADVVIVHAVIALARPRAIPTLLPASRATKVSDSRNPSAKKKPVSTRATPSLLNENRRYIEKQHSRWEDLLAAHRARESWHGSDRKLGQQPCRIRWLRPQFEIVSVLPGLLDQSSS